MAFWKSEKASCHPERGEESDKDEGGHGDDMMDCDMVEDSGQEQVEVVALAKSSRGTSNELTGRHAPDGKEGEMRACQEKERAYEPDEKEGEEKVCQEMERAYADPPPNNETCEEAYQLEIQSLKSALSTQEQESLFLRNTLERLYIERDRLYIERDKYAECCEDWKQEAERLGRVVAQRAMILRSSYQERHQNQAPLKRQQTEIAALRKQLRDAKSSEQKSRKEAEKARKQAAEATTTSEKLFQMLESPVVKRKSKGRTEYPNGDDLQAKLRSSQEEAEDYFRDLADCFPNDQFGVGGDVHQLLLKEVLMPVAKSTLAYVEHLVDTNRNHLLVLVGDEERLKNRLVHLFWVSSMQKLVSQITASADPIEMSDDQKASFDPTTQKILTWASQPEIREHEEMEGRNIGTFARDLAHLQLFCEFSEPPCFLHPAVGEQVQYDPAHHAVKHLHGRKASKVTAGKLVHVLYPGLYFAHPDTKERNRSRVTPTVKAIVVYF